MPDCSLAATAELWTVFHFYQVKFFINFKTLSFFLSSNQETNKLKSLFLKLNLKKRIEVQYSILYIQ